MSSIVHERRSGRINLRTSAQQESLIRRGAEQRGETLTEFIVRSACTEAEHALADQKLFILSNTQWRAFTSALDRPPRPKPRLAKLFRETVASHE
jgi:uncharacterized protein (DUF1778 family)